MPRRASTAPASVIVGSGGAARQAVKYAAAADMAIAMTLRTRTAGIVARAAQRAAPCCGVLRRGAGGATLVA